MGTVVGSVSFKSERSVLCMRGSGSLRLTSVMICSLILGLPVVLGGRFICGCARCFRASEALRSALKPISIIALRAISTPRGLVSDRKSSPAFLIGFFEVKFIRERKFLSKTVTSPKLILTGQGCRHFMHSVQ